ERGTHLFGWLLPTSSAQHAAAGNRAEALRAYKRCRDVLADERGVTPPAATEAAYSRRPCVTPSAAS
ncbi:MAG: hypothetical protein H0U41_06570, partial [Actinobacteria bacterium]|nr:hypothetical protein [Actinomycetota bacterium]